MTISIVYTLLGFSFKNSCFTKSIIRFASIDLIFHPFWQVSNQGAPKQTTRQPLFFLFFILLLLLANKSPGQKCLLNREFKTWPLFHWSVLCESHSYDFLFLPGIVFCCYYFQCSPSWLMVHFLYFIFVQEVDAFFSLLLETNGWQQASGPPPEIHQLRINHRRAWPINYAWIGGLW